MSEIRILLPSRDFIKRLLKLNWTNRYIPFLSLFVNKKVDRDKSIVFIRFMHTIKNTKYYPIFS